MATQSAAGCNHHGTAHVQGAAWRRAAAPLPLPPPHTHISRHSKHTYTRKCVKGRTRARSDTGRQDNSKVKGEASVPRQKPSRRSALDSAQGAAKQPRSLPALRNQYKLQRIILQLTRLPHPYHKRFPFVRGCLSRQRLQTLRDQLCLCHRAVLQDLHASGKAGLLRWAMGVHLLHYQTRFQSRHTLHLCHALRSLLRCRLSLPAGGGVLYHLQLGLLLRLAVQFIEKVEDSFSQCAQVVACRVGCVTGCANRVQVAVVAWEPLIVKQAAAKPNRGRCKILECVCQLRLEGRLLGIQTTQLFTNGVLVQVAYAGVNRGDAVVLDFNDVLDGVPVHFFFVFF
ncbi:proteasome 26S non-ATPase subunit 9, putative [Leishmania tarentolae]|uniref:Proteasome 26S non-ATPase subunit 9, putative n=1 Tax=Leishmania tarentolae TaxID=5689 RepID=A0A640KDV3_LEITA|nr:proteasome 26S non-ATPase subunit 9, putative [Leishmania tarentolae]